MGAMIHDAILDAVTISQCTQASVQTNATIGRGRSSGAVVAEATFLESAEPVATWTTTDVFTVLDEISLTAGLCIDSGSIAIPWQTQTCAGAAGTGNHTILSASDAFVMVSGISARQGDTASANIEMCALSTDGIAAPFTAVNNGNLTSDTFIGEYRLGPVKINGTTVSGVMGIQVNPALSYLKRTTGGGTYPTHTYLEFANPTVDVTFENQATAAIYGPIFLTMSAGVFYLRKKATGGGVVADGTASHIGISFGAGIVTMEQISGSERSPAEVTLRFHGYSLSVNTATAIS